jgi:hypothetical protein
MSACAPSLRLFEKGDSLRSSQRMTRFLKTAVLAGALSLLGTCAHEPPIGTPGVDCMVASCCYGVIRDWVGVCMAAQPPFCGCTCKESPRPYATREACEAANPPLQTDAGVLRFQ